jgi:5'-3' exonuclease
MGIPSYYKKLSERIKGLISKSRPGSISSLFFDFNCLIYHCARRPNSTLPPYPGSDSVSRKEEWEALLLEDIAKYVQHIWHEAGKPPNVFLSIDGVVPMAKIKQQRLRRFKSIWLNQQEPSSEPKWDTNCITPSTDFMKRLSQRLDLLCKRHKGWQLSSDLEPGEGEHKIMKLLREKKNEKGPILVYGLDADLILLTMLNAPCEAYLMREDSEMGVVQTNLLGDESFSYFSIDVLKQTLWNGKTIEYLDILEYVTAMTLLGNDFLPHSLSIKIRDDGHKFLVGELKSLVESGQRLVKQVDGLWKLNYEALHWLLKRWATVEQDRLLHTCKKKIQMRGTTQMTQEALPLLSPVEYSIVQSHNREWSLKEGWQDVYTQQWLACKDQEDLEKCCREYLLGLQWVLDYYTGQRAVDMTWFYPRLIPPLWSHLELYLSLGKPIPEPAIGSTDPIQPQEQLAMVLPLESWHHIPVSSPLRSIPYRYPQFWPSKFGFFTAGRVWTWECEPLLPILPVQALRQTA